MYLPLFLFSVFYEYAYIPTIPIFSVFMNMLQGVHEMNIRVFYEYAYIPLFLFLVFL